MLCIVTGISKGADNKVSGVIDEGLQYGVLGDVQRVVVLFGNRDQSEFGHGESFLSSWI